MYETGTKDQSGMQKHIQKRCGSDQGEFQYGDHSLYQSDGKESMERGTGKLKRLHLCAKAVMLKTASLPVPPRRKS